MQMMLQTLTKKMALVIGFVHTLVARSQMDESICCFPTQMEGNFEISTINGDISFRKGRFAVDYDKGRAIFRHPDKDDVYVLQDFKNELLYVNDGDNGCLITPLTKNDTFLRCVPGDARKTMVYIDGFYKGVDDWVAKRPLSGKEGEVELMYISVNSSDCLPRTIHRFMNVGLRMSSKMFHNMSEKIQDPKILYPDDKNCVMSPTTDSGASRFFSFPAVFMMTIMSLFFVSLC